MPKTHDSPEFRKFVCENIDDLIKRSGITKMKISDDLNVETSTLSKYTNGTMIPSPEKIKKLCLILNCKYEDILGSLD